jgi:GNAT superfamily N-acetyltransferase
MIHLRPALKSDATFLAELEAEVMQPHAAALWGKYLPTPVSAFDLASTRLVVRGEIPVGYVTIEANPDHLRLRKMYLTAKAQGQGIGAEVLDMVRHEAKASGLPLRLSVLEPNRRALAFYLREGLHVTETTTEQVFLQTPAQSLSC